MAGQSSTSRHARRHSSGSESFSSASGLRSSTRTHAHSRKYSKSAIATSINEITDGASWSSQSGSALTQYATGETGAGHGHVFSEGFGQPSVGAQYRGSDYSGQESRITSASNGTTESGSSRPGASPSRRRKSSVAPSEPPRDAMPNLPQVEGLAPLKPLSPIVLPEMPHAQYEYFGNAGLSESTSHIPVTGGRTLGLYTNAASREPIAKSASWTKLKTDNPNAYVIRADVSSGTGEGEQSETRQPEMIETSARRLERSPRRNMHRGEETAKQRSQHRSSDPMKKLKREKDNKALAKALKRANDAVLLDNAQEYTKAVEAYEESCDLLLQVMTRGSDKERFKLEPVRNAYLGRVEELHKMEQSETTDSFEKDSEQGHSEAGSRQGFDKIEDEYESGRDRNDTLAGTAEIEQNEAGPQTPWLPEPSSRSFASTSGSPGQASERTVSVSSMNGFDAQEIESLVKEENKAMASLATPMDEEFMPRPLSPFRTNDSQPEPTEKVSTNDRDSGHADGDSEGQARRPSEASDGSLSWLNTVEGSMVSSHSSMHSRSSGTGLHRKHIRVGSGDTEAEFDAALDAAVEAAYGDGYDIYRDGSDTQTEQASPSRTTTEHTDTRRSIEMPLDREAIISAAKARETERRRNQRPFQHNELEFGDPADSDEEERLLEEASTDFVTENQPQGHQAKSILPRQSDSSNSSGRTWGSSVASSLNTGGTSLSTVDEHAISASLQKQQPPKMPPPAPPPTTALPPTPPAKSPPSQNIQTTVLKAPRFPGSINSPSVQDRRGTGQRAKKLKIETSVGSRLDKVEPVPDQSNRRHLAAPPNTATGTFGSDARLAPDHIANQTGLSPINARFISSPFPSPFIPSQSPPTPGLTTGLSFESSGKPSPQSASSNVALNRAHLRPDGNRNKGLLSPAGQLSDESPGTPMSFAFNSLSPGQRVPLNTPVGASLAAQARPSTGVSLFDNEIHSIVSPASTDPRVGMAPRPLEPCPEPFLLRPFWLMRCLHQTLSHPKGGYLSTKLFIPREVWRVKNVKLKGIEDKIANCDLLTAALLKLSAVDTLDADAVLEEMQALEGVLDQAQANLTKKLGNEVGVQTLSSFFKDAPMAGSGPESEGSLDPMAKSSKGYLSTWRKLRSKNSSANLVGQVGARDASKENLTMSTVPTTSYLAKSSRQNRYRSETGGAIKADGPNAQYMSSLARLCDAVQVLDQIARQVEDPGLKHTSPTHVGLELCTRHAAEFFGFYICRFILQDVTMLAEKFVKRASEWVLS